MPADFNLYEDRMLLAENATKAAATFGAATDDDILAYVGYAVADAKAEADGVPAAMFDIAAIITMIMELFANCRDPEKQVERVRKHPRGLLSWPARSAAKQQFRQDPATRDDAAGWADAGVKALCEASDETVGRLLAKVKKA